MRIFDLKFSDQETHQMQRHVADILDRGFLTNDQFVAQFERSYARWNDSPWAVAASNGTAAIEMALKAIGVSGKKVIIPTNTFIATAIAVINACATPIVIDIEPDYMGLCPEKLLAALEQHPEVGAVCHVHIGGHVSTHFQKVIEICRKYRVELIEDACHGIGAALNGIRSGNFGRFGCYSFFTTKNMTTGEGGMVVCHRKDDLRKLQSIRQFGKSPENNNLHIGPGNNYKMNEFSAALGIIELQRIDLRIARRREIAQRYQYNLRASHYSLLKDHGGSIGSYYKQVITSDIIPISKVQKFLSEKQIPLTGGVYYLPLHKQRTSFERIGREEFKNSDWFSAHHFCPPCYPELIDEQVDQVCEHLLTLEKFYL